MSGSNRIKSMLIAMFLGRGVMAIRQLLMVPLLIRLWGTEYYGEWLALSAIPTFLAMSNLGLGTAASIQIGQYVAAGKNAEAWSIYSTTMAILFAVVALVIALFALLLSQLNLLSYCQYINSPGIVLFCLSASALLRVFVPPNVGWWVGTGVPGKSQNWNNVYFFLEIVFFLVVLACGGRALAVSVSTLLWSFAWGTLYTLMTYRRIERISITAVPAPHRWLTAWKLLKVGIGHQLNPLWQALLFQGSLLLAAGILGPAGAALWGAMRVLIRSVYQLIEILSLSLAPEFQIAYGNEDWDKLRKLHSAGQIIAFAIAFLGLGFLLLFGRSVFNVWTNGVFEVSWITWSMFAVSVLPFSLWSISSEFQRSANLPWYANASGTLLAALSLIVMLSASSIGIIGMCIGMLFFDICMALVITSRSYVLLSDGFLQSIQRGYFVIKGRIITLPMATHAQ